jgi:cystatin-C
MLFGAATALTASTAISQIARAACGVLGGWCEIKDVTEPRVQELGKWAVTEHNLQTGSDLQFVAVTSGEEQVVSGMNYNLVIETKGSGKWGAGLFDPPRGKLQLNWFNRLLG